MYFFIWINFGISFDALNINIFFCFKIIKALFFTASCDGPGRIFLIWSRDFANCWSISLIFWSIDCARASNFYLFNIREKKRMKMKMSIQFVLCCVGRREMNEFWWMRDEKRKKKTKTKKETKRREKYYLAGRFLQRRRFHRLFHSEQAFHFS